MAASEARKVGANGLLLALAVAACGDDPASPSRVPTSVQAETSTDQTAAAGASVPAAPTVLVADSRDEPMGGVTVRFEVVAGGGSLQFTTVQTNAQGVASAGRWTLGPSPGVNSVDAQVEGLAPVRFTATGLSAYSITVRYIGTATARQREAVDAAVRRWASVIVSDVSDIPMSVAAATCFAGQPAINETVDDLLLFVEFANIDGPGDALGQGGPCYVRNDSDLPVIGYLNLDAADLAQLQATGALDDVVLHEIGHVIGFGTIWPRKSLLTGAASSNPEFVGPDAIQAYRQLGGAAPAVPVENTGSSGTRDSHWRESVFGTELMTGYLSTPPNPLSIITVASLQDLGYTVNRPRRTRTAWAPSAARVS